jgi:hypothetical protein
MKPLLSTSQWYGEVLTRAGIHNVYFESAELDVSISCIAFK